MRSELRRLLSYSVRYWPTLFVSVILMAIAGITFGLIVKLGQPVIDHVLNPNHADQAVKLFDFAGHTIFLNDILPFNLHEVWSLVGIAILLAFLVRGVCDYLGNYLINRVGLQVVTDIRTQVFDHVLHQDTAFFEQNTTGQLMSSILNDIDKIQVAAAHILADWFRQMFAALALLAVVFSQDWKMALFSLTVLPIVVIPTIKLGRRIRRSTRRAQDHTAELNQVMQEALSGQQVVKSFAGEDHESARFLAAADRVRNSSLKYVAQQSIASPLIEFFGAVTIVLLLTYARIQIQNQAMTAGAFISFLLALLLLYEPAKRLVGIFNIFQQGLGASQKVFQYLDEHRSIEEKPNARKLENFSSSIEWRDVHFLYRSSSTPVLNGVQLTVKAGEIAALVGPSGAGKTTLANLLPRFYEATSGAVLIDGVDIRNLTLRSLREKIGIVAQDTFLFNDTVANNIRYGHFNAPMESVKAAARNALAEEFINALPQGFDTIIGERGARLSGGQRQRLSIARALLKNAPILILDEATSHLDTESEMLVQKALANLMENRTVIVIAHRLSTIRRADKIVVLDRGQVSEIGSHEELVSGGGIYQRLHELQYLEGEIEA